MRPEAIAPSVRTSAAAVRQLRRLYRDIHACEQCLGDSGCHMAPDEERVVRRVVTRGATSPLFLVGQAYGPDTQRRSGLPYTYPNGSLSQTGRVLDEFLGRIGFTIDPMGVLPYAYSSDIVQRYPGPASTGGGDRRPTAREVANCGEWLESELLIVLPRVVVCLGVTPAEEMLRRYADARMDGWGRAYRGVLRNHTFTIVPVYHPAFRRRNARVVDRVYSRAAHAIREILPDAQ